MTQDVTDHDTWNYSPPKTLKAPNIKLGDIHGVLPFDGVRNPGARSATSHKFWFLYQTPANDLKPKVAICESAAEAAVALDALITPNVHDVSFQPLTVHYQLDGKRRQYTHDLLITFNNGYRRLLFVRNDASLKKPKTQREIRAIEEMTPRNAANDLKVVNALDFPRQKRENLFRMHAFLQDPDPEADDLVLATARSLIELWQMKDLFPHVDLPQKRIFRACYRLVARRQMLADLNNVFLETSRVEVAP